MAQALAREAAEMDVGAVMEVVEAEVRQSKLRSAIDSEMSRLREADLAFLVDCTQSMEPYIDAVKKYITTIVETMQKR